MIFVQFIKTHLNSFLSYFGPVKPRQAILALELEEMRIKNPNFEKEVIWDYIFE